MSQFIRMLNEFAHAAVADKSDHFVVRPKIRHRQLLHGPVMKQTLITIQNHNEGRYHTETVPRNVIFWKL